MACCSGSGGCRCSGTELTPPDAGGVEGEPGDAAGTEADATGNGTPTHDRRGAPFVQPDDGVQYLAQGGTPGNAQSEIERRGKAPEPDCHLVCDCEFCPWEWAWPRLGKWLEQWDGLGSGAVVPDPAGDGTVSPGSDNALGVGIDGIVPVAETHPAPVAYDGGGVRTGIGAGSVLGIAAGVYGMDGRPRTRAGGAAPELAGPSRPGAGSTTLGGLPSLSSGGPPGIVAAGRRGAGQFAGGRSSGSLRGPSRGPGLR